MPLPGTRVIHPALQAHLGPVATGGMTATIDILDPNLPGTETYDRTTGLTTVVPAPPVHAGVPARIQPLSRGQGEGVADAAGQDVVTPPYLVAVPAHLTADEDWIVRVVACADDTALVGRRLTVRRISYASTRIERDLFCEDE